MARDDSFLHCYNLFKIFKQFRDAKQAKELINYLVTNYPGNVKNKTFNFFNTRHLFHSLYAYIPSIGNVEKERKQIRLSEECIEKLFNSTINDFKLYEELFEMIKENKMNQQCPCQLLIQRRNEIKQYVNNINSKSFDTKPPKLKKEKIDNIMYKYSLNWKNLLLKQKIKEMTLKNLKKKRKLNKRTIMTNECIYLRTQTKDKLNNINGMNINTCDHKYITVEKQLRAGDEIVSFIKLCELCHHQCRA